MSPDETKWYLQSMEENRIRNEPFNKRAYADAREISAILSILEHGNPIAAKQARKILKKFC